MPETVDTQLQLILPQVLRPGRYVGHEINVIQKEWREIPVRVALAFPDVYEIGMSHVGMQLLYHQLNRPDWLMAERVYSPWTDMERLMRKADVPLFSLESKRPIKQFDMVGITMQYELHYTNILNLLDLAGIPIESRERSERDPLIVAGGPLAYNPEPLAEFLDVVVLGDGEKIGLEIAKIIRQAKREQWPRAERIAALSRLDGVYIPSYYSPEYCEQNTFVKVDKLNDEAPNQVRATMVSQLDEAFFPDKPLVPLIEITHDRFSMEIMRGCARGCRFCNAGMVYRPVRIRPVDALIRHAKNVIANTGYDEISLISLSSSDYPDLYELMQRLQYLFHEKGVTISFPSLRTETFTEEIADLARDFRKGGLTLAPEAGTQRLRDVINKNNTEDDLLKAMKVAFDRGWRRIKLYFMIGLPTETQEDIQGIVDLVGKAVKLAKSYGRKEIHVSISPFSPKPQTPFQWDGQDSLEQLTEKSDFLKNHIRWREVKLSWRDPNVSRLEAVLGLGDRRMGRAIYHAWKRGARFDGWTEQFKFQIWESAFRDAGLSMDAFLGPKSENAAFPWDHLSKGVTKSFLKKEHDKSIRSQSTADCFTSDAGCQGCGLMHEPACKKPGASKKSASKQGGEHFARRVRLRQDDPVIRKVRFEFAKGESVRFTSHLDMMRIFARAFRRAHIDVALSEGFHAHPRISAGPPLPLGYIGEREYLDVDLKHSPPRNMMERLNEHLPESMEVTGMKSIFEKVESLNSAINMAVYRVLWPEIQDDQELYQRQIDAFIHTNTCRVERKNKTVDIRPFVRQVRMSKTGLDVITVLTPNGTVRISEIIEAIQPGYLSMPDVRCVTRTGLFIEKHGEQKTPLEAI